MAAQLPATTSQGSLLPAQLTNTQTQNNSSGGFLSGLSSAADFLGGIINNPITSSIGLLLKGAIYAVPRLYNWIKQNNVNNKITKSQKALQQLTQLPNQSDPNIQRQIQEQQAILSQYAQENPNNQSGIPEGGFWSGRQAYNEQIPLYTPNTERYREEVIDQLRNNPANFGPVREEAVRRFKQETVPYLAEQYFGRNPQSFGGVYPEALGRAGANLNRQLAADEQRFNAEREGRLMNIATQPSFSTVRHPREPGFGESFLTPLLSNAAGSALNYGSQWLQNRFGGGNVPQEIVPSQVILPQQRVQNQSTNPNAYQVPGMNPADLSQLSNTIQNKNPSAFQKLLEGRNSVLGGRTR